MISSYSIVENLDNIGENTSVWHFTHIRDTARIGKNCIIGSHCYIDKDVTIEDNCKIQSGCMIFHPAHIKYGVFLGPGVMILNDKYPKAVNDKGFLITENEWGCHQVVVGSRASIGAGSIILPGISIGSGALIGAGSVVTKDVLDNAVVSGDSAKIIRFI